MTTEVKSPTLYYIHDPMCSWCWAFAPRWTELQKETTSKLRIVTLLGGLAPDSDEPMPQHMQSHLQSTWQNIEQTVPGTQFNYDFWSDCKPRRSTYPSCRAVISARQQSPTLEAPMTTAIQKAYYLGAKNPSDKEVLVEIAASIGADKNRFSEQLTSIDVENAFQDDLAFARSLGIRGFPSLVLGMPDNQFHLIHVSYNRTSDMLDQLSSIIS